MASKKDKRDVISARKPLHPGSGGACRQAATERVTFSFPVKIIVCVCSLFFFEAKAQRKKAWQKKKGRKEISRSAERAKGAALDPQTFEKV